MEIHIGRILFTINLYRFIYIYTFITNCGSSYVVGWEAMDGVLQEDDSDLVYKVNRRDVGGKWVICDLSIQQDDDYFDSFGEITVIYLT